jgi:hypothetical protein
LGPFEFIILFFSFIYTLALTHLLFAATRMIRHRRELVFSWPHALWMLNALLLLVGIWMSLWDFHRQKTLSLAVIVGGFAFVIAQYLICALAAPDFEDGDSLDLRAFHERESGTYILAFAAILPLAPVLNLAGAAGVGIANWANQNAIVLAMAPPILIPLFVKAKWAQVGAPLVLVAVMAIFLVVYYPVIG